MRIVRSTMFLLLLALPAAARAQLPQKPVLTLDAAKRAAAAAEALAVQNQWKVVIAIVDDGGHLVHLQRMDDVQYASVEVALAKARSAAGFRQPTKVFAERLAAGGATGLLALPGAIPIEGGVPIAANGKVIGAIGVSGVTSQQDGLIAQAGAAAVAAMAE